MSLRDTLKSWGALDADQSLIRAARRGDRPAFDSLVHSYEHPLRGFLVRRVGPSAVDDVLQETWLAAWTALPRFVGRSRFKAWLFGIALHKAADYQRARVSSPLWTDLESLEEYALTAPDPFAAADLQHAVRAALAGLPESQREVLDMYYYADLTLSEIAEALRRNLNTVKYQFYRAHARIADVLPEYAPPPGAERR